MPNPQLMPWRQANEIYSIQDMEANVYFDNFPDQLLLEEYQIFAVFEGDTHLKDIAMVTDDIENALTRAIIVNGDLTVEDSIDMFFMWETYPAYLYVAGNLKAKNIVIAGEAEIIVKGNVELTGTLSATDSSVGKFCCLGDFKAQNVYANRFNARLGQRVDTQRFYFVNEHRADDYLTIGAEYRRKIVFLAEWNVKDFDGIDEIEDEADPRWQANLIFKESTYEPFPYGFSEANIRPLLLKGEDIFV